MFRSFAKAAAAAAAVFVLSAAAHAQGAPLQLSQALDPPGTADLKPQVESKKPVKSSAAKRHTAAPKAVPVDAGTAARAAGVKIAPASGSAKSANKASTGQKPTKKTRGKKAAKAAAPIEAVAPAAPSRLTGEAAWAKLVGNSVSGMYNGSWLVDAYLPDNTVKSKVNGEVQTGRWGFVEGKACFQYPPEAQATCYDVAIDGSDVTYTDTDGEVTHLTLASGIPANM